MGRQIGNVKLEEIVDMQSKKSVDYRSQADPVLIIYSRLENF